MIKEVSGDILLTDYKAMAHGISPNDNFSSGLALSLREEWPSLYKDFRHYCKTYHPEPGNIWAWVNAEGFRIINLMTQSAAYKIGEKPGKATVENVNHSLRALRKLIEDEEIESLALPRLSTGVGGLDWAEVKPLIEHHLGDLKTRIEIYTIYHKGIKAE